MHANGSELSAWALGTQVLLEAELADEIAAELESRSPGTSAGRLAELNLRLLSEAHETAHDLPGVTRVAICREWSYMPGWQDHWMTCTCSAMPSAGAMQHL